MYFEHGRTTIRMWPDFAKDEVEAVINNLRPTDRHEGEAVGLFGQDYIDHCRAIVASTPLSYLVSYDGRPVFMFGLMAIRPHHSVLWGFGTGDTRKAIPAVTRYVKREWLETMARAGIRRIEARLPATCLESRQWLKSCGMDTECELPGVSVTEEPFVQLAWTRK